MKQNKLLSALALILSLTLLLGACSAQATQSDSAAQQVQSQAAGTEKTASTDSTSDAKESVLELDVSDRDASGDYDEAAAETLSGSTITAGGTYVLTGTLSETLVIDAGDTEKVQLVLSGVTISVSDGPAIYVKSADKVFLTVEAGTENLLSDGESYSLTDGTTSVDACVFSKSDLTINGSGVLTILGNNAHGVVSKDDLVVTAEHLSVTAAKTALTGKDSVTLADATVHLIAGTDAIRSDNDEDSEKGSVTISGSSVTIEAGKDGVQAETSLSIETSTLDITTGGGSANRSYDSSESYKGLKAGTTLTILSGSFTLDCLDDAIHASDVQISGGSLQISTGDDGVHADAALDISGGELSILTSYEALEGETVNISGGTLLLNASDDGINAAGGNDSGTGGFFGFDRFSGGSGTLNISGGYLLVNASGDGLDSNGDLNVSGGVVLVSGPTNDGNGAIDFEATGTVTGGVVIALGSSGMAMNFSQAENQGSILLSTGAQAAGTNFALVDANGQVVASFTPSKAYASAVVTAPGIQEGGSYSVVLGGSVSDADENGFAQSGTVSGGSTLQTIQMSGLIYGSGMGMGGFGGGMGGQGGFGGQAPGQAPGQGGFGGQGGPGRR